ncbi:GatB/YqeY domain-containing protein [Helicobacter sp. MIT 14-3879]|uniref:GatB/YqeY domain-containing protein n=1 Tax=Helicobacter sp. MIT 14-3879 TaxID=2040649 RepID=UPI000E1EE41F|nr:GatB/YqeY domain-containing protein [Helicobacter sp. MIT 14-3879]RDU65103.1 glutamyl-tRNA amidotransferase [Helicobacter sp. MIT 14-3879]
MTIKEKLNNDLKNAMKNNDTFTRDTIRLLNSAFKQIEVDKRIEINDDEAIKILLSAKKQRLDSIEAYKKAFREDLVKKEEQELEIILQYLPRELSDNELEAKLKEIIQSLNVSSIKDLGKVMGASKGLYSVASGNRISAMAKKLLET